MGEDIKSLARDFARLKLDDTSGMGRAEHIVKEILQYMDNKDQEFDIAVVTLLEKDVLEQLKSLLSSSHSNIYECSAKLVAEVAKQEEARQPCVELVQVLLQLLSNNNIQVLIQVCRALGNICFDNDNGRQTVDEQGGVNTIIDLLQRYICTSTEGADRLRVVACGFLLNLTNSCVGVRRPSIDLQHPVNLQKLQPASPSDPMRMVTLQLKFDRSLSRETIQDKAILQGGIEILNQYLEKHSDDENVCQMALLSLGCLIESELGKSKLSECHVAVTVGELLGTETGEEIQDLIFELLSTMAETDSVKLQLVKSSVIEKILVLIKANEHSSDEDGLDVIKMATDLFPTLLHGDVSMEALFQEGKGKLYLESLNWLRSSNEHLRVAGALTIGNFAIKDTNCIYLVKEGVHEKMLDSLDSTNSSGDNNPGLQHAVFSSLRNLSIPAQNKSSLYKSGILDRILPFVFRAEVTPVQFKMLGTFRLLVDGQEQTATALGTNEKFVSQIMSWCNIDSHPGVKAESNRLISWLIKHSRNPDVMEMIVNCGGTPNLCGMMHSEHAVMQNEALVALTLIATNILDKITANFIESEVVPAIKVLLTDEDVLSEILYNTATLVLVLSKSEELKELMRLADFTQLFQDFSENHEDSSFKEQAKNAYCVLK